MQNSKCKRQNAENFLKKVLPCFAFCIFNFAFPINSFCSSGSEGASFLNIPVGAGPAALGSAYTALANDAYAPVWNPAGLGFVETSQFAAQHLSYLESINDEYLGFAHPLHPGQAIGASVQYLGTGDIQQTDLPGNSLGTFSNHYAAYSLAYGQRLGQKASLGITGKWINAALSDVQANAYAFDLGGLYKVNSRVTVGATVA